MSRVGRINNIYVYICMHTRQQDPVIFLAYPVIQKARALFSSPIFGVICMGYIHLLLFLSCIGQRHHARHVSCSW